MPLDDFDFQIICYSKLPELPAVHTVELIACGEVSEGVFFACLLVIDPFNGFCLLVKA